MQLLGARQRHHGIAMRERAERSHRFMRRPRRRDEVDRVQVKSTLRGLRYRDVPGVNRIERSPEKCDRARLTTLAAMARGVRRDRGMRHGQTSSPG